MDPCSTLFGGFFLLGLILGMNLVVMKLKAWTSTPGSFCREIGDHVPELLTSVGIFCAMIGGALLPDLAAVFYKPIRITDHQQTVWSVIGLTVPLIITIPPALWFSSKRKNRK